MGDERRQSAALFRFIHWLQRLATVRIKMPMHFDQAALRLVKRLQSQNLEYRERLYAASHSDL